MAFADVWKRDGGAGTSAQPDTAARLAEVTQRVAPRLASDMLRALETEAFVSWTSSLRITRHGLAYWDEATAVWRETELDGFQRDKHYSIDAVNGDFQLLDQATGLPVHITPCTAWNFYPGFVCLANKYRGDGRIPWTRMNKGVAWTDLIDYGLGPAGWTAFPW